MRRYINTFCVPKTVGAGSAIINRRRNTAYHEASHAVIGRVLTLYCGSATIKRDHESAGHSVCHDPNECVHQWEIRGKIRDNFDAIWHARIIAFMAGAEAESLLLGSTNGGDGEDRRQIERMAEELENCKNWDRLERRLRTMTRTLVRRHQVLIDRVANALLRKTTMTGTQLDKLIGRSVNDVRVNSPMTLALHRRRSAILIESSG